ncbi:MAG: penicillin-binding protein 1B [Bdellovibrio sp.]|nr:MAG: penicillin-binding protein 1B [Bdellovibrio sp.]
MSREVIKRWRSFLYVLGALTLLIMAIVAIGLQQLDGEISIRLKTREFLAPTTYWALPDSIHVQNLWKKSEIQALFKSHLYREVLTLDELKTASYLQRTCDSPPFNLTGDELNGKTCWYFRLPETTHPALKEFRQQAFSMRSTSGAERNSGVQPYGGGKVSSEGVLDDSEGSEILQAWVLPRQGQWTATDEVRFEPQRVAQFVGGKPLLQEWTPLGEIPTTCLNSVLGIEDPRFLEHSGINWRGLARAALVNLMSGRFAQGGSTITQQMVKNFFLNSEKTLSRKARELGMAVLLESKLNKDQIFEIYLNIIYLGQSGPFQVHGYSAAARHFFQKRIQDLNLPECALMAAVLNSPGTYDPFTNHEKALKRRHLVLTKMLNNQMISEDEMQAADQAPLPVSNRHSVDESAPYFLEAVHRELSQSESTLEGLQVFTTMNLRAQEAAQRSLLQQLLELEKSNGAVGKLAKSGLHLEGIAVSLEMATGRILAAVGGRGFRTSPFNRILDGKRQIGSLAKPFVYLSAFEQDHSLTPFSTITDEKTSYHLHRQVWTPENYTKKYFGEVSLTFALKNSLNAATAALGMKTGIPLIVSNIHKAGVDSPIEEVPSITLGAMDLKPIEMVEAYLTLSRFGNRIKPRFYEWLVRSQVGAFGTSTVSEQAIEHVAVNPVQALDRDSTAMVLSMMKQGVQSGTSQAIGKSGFSWPAAGKTGTTSDYRDAWFVGFTPWDMTLIWVGYDQNQSHHLTGATGAVPVWLPIMKILSEHRPVNDFPWPEGMKHEQRPTPPDTEPVDLVTR